jgi:ferric enterobactin receptor
MKNLFVSLLLIAVGGQAIAQSTALPGRITGSLIDSVTTKPVPYATVALLDGARLVTGTTTDGAGAFVLPGLATGRYSLTLSFVGYRTKTLPVLLTADAPALALGEQRLAPEGKTLSEVKVTGQKPLIENKGDRLVYNADQDISNAGGTAVDVLRKVPMLSVDVSGNVQMRGSGNIKVLVNGKPSAIMARNLADALRQLPANTIKAVEVITSPGAKYDAEGSAGIINIITKKALQGFNGSVNATVGDLELPYRALGTRLNWRTKKLGIALALNPQQFGQISRTESSRTTLVNGRPVNTLNQISTSNNVSNSGSGQLSLDYDLDSLNRINVAGDAWGGDFPGNSTTFNRLTAPDGTLLQDFRNDLQFSNPYGNTQFDLGYTRTLKQKKNVDGQGEFSILTQYSRMPDNYFYTTTRYGASGPDQYNLLINRQQSTNYSRNKEYTLQTDYAQPFTIRSARDTTGIRLEIGAKTILRNIGSEFRVEQSLTGGEPMVPDPSLSNDFAYTQRIYSGYTSVSLSNRHKWNLTAGARFEQTVIDGDFKTTNTQLASRYANLIPSFTLSKGIGIHTWKLSYTQRIQRPLVWYLNPWVNQSDPRNITTGNPNLLPELSHATEIGHSLTTKGGISLNSALFWRQTNNAIEYIGTADATGIVTTRPQNIGQRGVFGLNLNLSGDMRKDLNLNVGTEVEYLDLRSPALNRQNTGWVGSLNANVTWKASKLTTLAFNSYFSTGYINLQGQNTGWQYYQVSAKREFWDKKASLTLRVTNPLSRDVKITSTQDAPTFTYQSTSYYVNRQLQLAFEWRFGQMSAGGKQSKKISNDDKAGR